MSFEFLLCCLLLIIVMVLIGRKVGDTPAKKIKRDPEVQEILKFFKAACSMPRQSDHIHLALVINARSKEPLQCQYYDIDESKKSIVNRPTGMYERQILENLLKEKGFPQCTFVELVGEVLPYGFILIYTAKVAYPNLLDQYTTVLAEECQKCGMTLVQEHCNSTNLQISLQNDLGDKK